MTDKQYVIRACEMLKLSLFKPSIVSKDILVYDYTVKPAKCIVDALKWSEAKQQLEAWRMKRANS